MSTSSLLFHLVELLDSSDDSDEEWNLSNPLEVLEGSEDENSVKYAAVVLHNVTVLTQRVLKVKIKNYVEISRQYTDSDFIVHFRLARKLAYDLIDKFEESEIYQKIKDTPGKETISPEKHILTFLWFAGHETICYRAVADRFDISLSSLFNIITRVSNFLLLLAPTVIRLPNNEEKLTIERHFRLQKSFPGVIGAVDGTHVKIDRPVEDPDSYMNRKHDFSIHMQGLVNHESKFLSVFIGYPGSVHDARVFQESNLPEELEDLCDEGQYILADSAYPCLPQVMTPYRDNGRLSRAQKNFNKRLSSCRIVVEHAFGILKQRFRQLYFCKLRNIVRCVKFIHACCVLHNLADEDELKLLEPRICIPFVENNIIQEVTMYDAEVTGNALRDELCRQFAA